MRYVQLDIPESRSQDAEWLSHRIVELCLIWHRNFKETVDLQGQYLLERDPMGEWVRFTKAVSKRDADTSLSLFSSIKRFPPDLLQQAYDVMAQSQSVW